MSLSGTVADYGTFRNVHLPLLGTYQPQNLSTVLAAIPLLRDAGLTIPDEAVYQGIAGVRWRGRFEKLCDAPLILSDGAHNPEGIAAAKESIKHYFGDSKVLLLVGVMADKDYNGMVAELAPLADRVFTLTPDNPRALSAQALADAFRAAGVCATGYATVSEAVAAAVDAAKRCEKPLISLGSLYMYAEVTDAMEKQGIIEAY
jgi:dihydrofolate synthase/folylpolyglutamate synthase